MPGNRSDRGNEYVDLFIGPLFTGLDQLAPDHTFASLYEHDGILLAAALASSLAWPEPGDPPPPTPLVLRGPVGVGKTHLLEAAARRRLENAPGARVLLLTAGDFIDLLGSAALSDGLPQLPEALLHGDLLFLDGLEDLAGKPAVLGEFCGLAARFVEACRPVIVTYGLRSRQSPGRLPSVFADHLPRARVVEVSPPDRRSAAEILRREVESLGGRISTIKARALAAWYARDGSVRKLKDLARRIAGRTRRI